MSKESFLRGFCKAASQAGVNPAVLVKYAQSIVGGTMPDHGYLFRAGVAMRKKRQQDLNFKQFGSRTLTPGNIGSFAANTNPENVTSFFQQKLKNAPTAQARIFQDSIDELGRRRQEAGISPDAPISNEEIAWMNKYKATYEAQYLGETIPGTTSHTQLAKTFNEQAQANYNAVNGRRVRDADGNFVYENADPTALVRPSAQRELDMMDRVDNYYKTYNKTMPEKKQTELEDYLHFAQNSPQNNGQWSQFAQPRQAMA